jgi:hypothetical protein
VATERSRTLRRWFLEIARRRARPGTGSSIETLRSRSWIDPLIDLSVVSVPYVIVGAVATTLYMPRRETQDLDVIIHARDARRIAVDLEVAGYTAGGRLSIGGTTWSGPHGEPLDVLESDEPWVDEAISHPQYAPNGLPVIRLPYLILLKLEASRTQDLADIQRMLGQADNAAMDEVRSVIQTYRPEDLDDLESLIVLGRMEYESPDVS